MKTVIKKIEGIIVNETPYGETSKVMQIFTKELGIISVMGKGVKSMKSRLRPFTMKFTYGFFYLYYKEDKLSILKEVDLIDSFKRIKSDILTISYLSYLSELSTQVYKHSMESLVYDLFIQVLNKMEQGMNPLILTNILEIKYLDFLGVQLYLEGCVLCGSKNNIVTIDADSGGYVCKKCYRNQIVVSQKTIKLIRMYYYVDVFSISKISISEEVAREINFFLNRYYEKYTGLYLQSKQFLNQMLKIQN